MLVIGICGVEKSKLRLLTKTTSIIAEYISLYTRNQSQDVPLHLWVMLRHADFWEIFCNQTDGKAIAFLTKKIN